MLATAGHLEREMVMTADVRADFRRKLGDEGCALMDEIEAYAGRQIDIKSDPAIRAEGGADSLVEHDKATIFVRDLDQLTCATATHELVHVKLVWIEQFPFLFPHYGSMDGYAQLNNLIQHLYIIPQEAGYGGGREDVWIERERKKWDTFGSASRDHQRQGATIGRATLALPTFDAAIALRQEADAKIDAAGLRAESDRFQRAVSDLKPPEVFAVALAVLGLRGSHGLTYRVPTASPPSDVDVPPVPAGY